MYCTTDLQSRVNGEGPGCRVHTRHVLSVVDVLEGELGAVVPVTVVDVLADERVRLHGEVLVHLRHVHVVDEVDEALGARGSVVAPGLLLQRLLQHPLQHLGRGVEVERHVGDHVVIGQTQQLVAHQYCLTWNRNEKT